MFFNININRSKVKTKLLLRFKMFINFCMFRSIKARDQGKEEIFVRFNEIQTEQVFWSNFV